MSSQLKSIYSPNGFMHFLWKIPGSNVFGSAEMSKNLLNCLSDDLQKSIKIYAYSISADEAEILFKWGNLNEVFDFLRYGDHIKEEMPDLNSLAELATGSGMETSELLSLHLSRLFKQSTLKWLNNNYSKQIKQEKNNIYRLITIYDENLKQVILNIHQKSSVLSEGGTSFNSYQSYLSHQASKLPREEVIQMFGNAEWFKKLHESEIKTV